MDSHFSYFCPKSIHMNKVFIVTLVSILLFQCKNEDDSCVAPGLSQNIIGSWTIKNSAFGFSDTGSATFNSDGSIVSNPDGFLISGEVNGVKLTKQSYTIKDSTITLKASSDAGGQFVTSSMDMKSNSCNEIKFDVLGGLGKSTFTRK